MTRRPKHQHKLRSSEVEKGDERWGDEPALPSRSATVGAGRN